MRHPLIKSMRGAVLLMPIRHFDYRAYPWIIHLQLPSAIALNFHIKINCHMKHPLSYDKVERLAPFIDEDEAPIEKEDAYARRFQQTFPNFPSEVISQWFYDHPQSIHQNSWLPFALLHFSLVELTTSEIFDSCFSKNPIVDQYRSHFEEANTSPRMSRLSAYIIENSTWPVPPIAIANHDAKIESPWGMKCDSPLHLLEGHHRFAVLHAYKSKIVLKPTHKLWIAKIGE